MALATGHVSGMMVMTLCLRDAWDCFGKACRDAGVGFQAVRQEPAEPPSRSAVWASSDVPAARAHSRWGQTMVSGRLWVTVPFFLLEHVTLQ